MNQPRVVIVGGGVAGISVLSTLTSQFVNKPKINITLIEKKNFIESGIYTLRYMVNPGEFQEKNSHVTLVELEKTFGKRNGNTVKIISHAMASSLDADQSKLTIQRFENDKLKSEEIIEFDYLVLANGCRYKSNFIKPKIDQSNFITPESRQEEFYQFYEKVTSKENDHVVIVGGGSLGIQMAGEMIDVNEWRHQHGLERFKITLIHSRNMLRDCSNSETAHSYIYNFLSKNGVHIELGKRAFYKDESIQSNPHSDSDPNIKKEMIIKPSSNSDISSSEIQQIPQASMVFWCGRMIPNTEWLDGSGISLNSSGCIQVNDFYQSKNYPNVFSIGDANDMPFEKLAGTAVREGIIVGGNIIRMLRMNDSASVILRERENFEKRGGKFELSLGSYNGLIGQMDSIKKRGKEAADIMTEKGRNRTIGLMRNPEIFTKKFGEFIQSCL